MLMKAQRVGGGTVPTHKQHRRYIGVDGQHQVPAAILPGKTRHPSYRRLGGRRGMEHLVSTGIRHPDRPDRSNSLYRLRSPGCTTKKMPISQTNILKTS